MLTKFFCELIALYYSWYQNWSPPTHFDFSKSPLDKLWNFKFEVLLNKTGIFVKKISYPLANFIKCSPTPTPHNVVSIELTRMRKYANIGVLRANSIPKF
jgi:hypothetical protein